MTAVERVGDYGEEFERLLRLRTSPIAIKLLKSEEEIPEGALRPKRDRGAHLALCQAFAMSRRQKATVAMLKEDHWCWAPLIGFGLVAPPDMYLEGRTSFPFMVADLDAAKDLAATEPRLEQGRYIGILSAPLAKAGFEPDAVLIYCNSGQLRTLLLAVKYQDGCRVTSTFDPIDSCVHSLVPAILTGQYRITVPDPGEYQRALATEDEMIFTVPKDRLEGLILGLRHIEERGHGYRDFSQEMRPDFPQPDFYKELFRKMGL